MNDVLTEPHSKIPPTRVGVVGARGYSGVELARLLLRHPQAQLCACFATQGFRLSDYLPEKAALMVPGYAVDDLFTVLRKEHLSVVFLATPMAVSLELAPKLLALGVSVIDLSGAFRLQAGSSEVQSATYQKWYQTEHSALATLAQAEYGLVPFVGKNKSSLIANPGCYASAILLGLLPLLKESLIDIMSLVVDAKSGTTGAGRKAEERLLHAEVDGVCLPYRVGRHQHEPEIQQWAATYAGVEIDFHFTPHLLNTRRGIIAGLYARVHPSLKAESREIILARLNDAYSSAYGEDPLIAVHSIAADGEVALNLRRVVGSARTEISYQLIGDKLYVFSLIDNLLKGAASQALENFNRLLGLPTWTSLTSCEGLL